MSSTFLIRDIATGQDIWEVSSGFLRQVEELMAGVTTPFERGIFYDVPVIGCDMGSQYSSGQDQPPWEGISGENAAQEMTAILEQLGNSVASAKSMKSLHSHRDVFKDLKTRFEQFPDRRYRGYVYF